MTPKRRALNLSVIFACLFFSKSLLIKINVNDSFIDENLETIFILPFFSFPHEITCIAGHLLTTDDESLVHHDHIWTMLHCL